MRTLAKLFITAVATLFTVPYIAAADTYPKHEMRSAWVATVWNLDWPITTGTTSTAVTAQKNECRAILDSLSAAGFNAVFFQARPMADRLYLNNSWTDPSTGTKYTVAEPFSSMVSGSRGKESTYDPLEYWITQAHARGMELHVWVNPYRTVTELSHAQDTAVKDWTILSKDGSGYAARIFNPGHPSTTARIQNVARVLTGNYDIDGIVFDDYFYLQGITADNTTSALDYSYYNTYKNGGGTLSIADWRRDNVNKMVKAVYNTIKGIKPYVRFGVGPAGVATKGLKSTDGIPPLSDYCKASDWQYDGICSDPLAWMRDKTVDYLSPQIYWMTDHSTNPYGQLSKWWSIVAQKFGRHFIASHTFQHFDKSIGNTQAGWDEMCKEIEFNRTNNLDGAFGSVFYSTQYATGKKYKGVLPVIRSKCYQYPALPPAMTWYTATDPGVVENLSFRTNKLQWTNKTDMRYVVYAIPLDVNPEAAKSDKGGFKADYIAAITYTSPATLTEQQSTGHWYAVTCLDRYGNEWKPATVDQPDYTPSVDPFNYGTVKVDLGDNQKGSLSLTSKWTRTFSDANLDADIELHRDMVAHSGQDGDIVYIVGRSDKTQDAASYLLRYDADNGELLPTLQLTYDNTWNPGYYPGNGIITDDANQLLTHTLTLANGVLSIAVVDPATGACRTVFSHKNPYRVDHLDVYGEAQDGKTWYIFAPSSTAVVRYTMNGTDIVATEEMTFAAKGNCARIHAVSPDKFWYSAQDYHASIYTFGNPNPIATLDGEGTAPIHAQATALNRFTLGGQDYLFYQTSYPAGTGVQWSLAYGNDFTTGTTGATHMWTFPADGGGITRMTSGDFGAPVSVLSPSAPRNAPALAPASSHTDVARLYAYSPGNALMSYTLAQNIETGVDNISMDNLDGAQETLWYDMSGRPVSHPTQPGLYISVNGNTVRKIKL